MPRILEIREIDGDCWVRVGKPPEFESGCSIWTPKEADDKYREGYRDGFNDATNGEKYNP